MQTEPRRILMTCALPYANGSIHLGHMVEHIQADIWARFQKMQGHECYFLCADDTHGTPIMVEAMKKKITPEQLIDQAYQEHTKAFADFGIEFDLYSSTNSVENKNLCEFFFSKLKSKDLIGTKVIDQLYCEHDKMFLPDRFVKGTCPKCGAKDQYGDSCDLCGATYSPVDLKDFYCQICRNTPVKKSSEQLLFQIDKLRGFLQAWLPEHLQKEAANKMLEWFNEPLRDWDISRNSPYFGFQIPGHTDKYFYVWVDAPMGYVSTTEQLSKTNPALKFDDFWRSEKTEVYHFIGKDIVYFHTLFWPALLHAADFRTPTEVFVHGHLMLNGEKMSKSKGTFINARTYLNHLDPMYLRYYYASKLSASMDDLDLNLPDFVSRVNSDLVGKITNLASRGAQMLNKKFGNTIGKMDKQGANLVRLAQNAAGSIAGHFERREYSKAITEIRALADEANRYFDEKAPWKTLETHPNETQEVLSTTLHLFRILAIYLKPVLPRYAVKVEKLFNEKPFQWSSVQDSLEGKKINAYEHLATRIDPEKVKAMMDEAAKANSAAPSSTTGSSGQTNKMNAGTGAAPVATGNKASAEPGVISIDDFGKVDLRVALIKHAEAIVEADKLLRLTVDLGPLGERQIIAGIKSAYAPEKLIGRHVVVVANLAPRKMKFGISEGMVIAAGNDSGLFVLSPDSGARAGDKVK